jgi:hypothetical protein
VYSAFGSALLVWQLARLGPYARVRTRDRVLAAAAAFFMILFRNTNVLLLIFYAALVGWRPITMRDRRHLWTAVGIGAAVGACIQLSYNYYAIGEFSVSSYVHEPFVWDRPMMASVLFSFERGLFTYYPIVFGVLAIGLARRASRAYTVALLVLILVYAALYGFWHSWHLGGGFGHRGFVELVPWMIAAAGLALADIERRADRREIVAAGLLMIVVPLQIMHGYWQGSFPFEGASETVYLTHLIGGLFGWYVAAAAAALLVVTDSIRSATRGATTSVGASDGKPPVEGLATR